MQGPVYGKDFVLYHYMKEGRRAKECIHEERNGGWSGRMGPNQLFLSGTHSHGSIIKHSPSQN
jgi:hypothetical protein